MNDYSLIKNNLEIYGRGSEMDKPWINRWYIIVFCFAPAALMAMLSGLPSKENSAVLIGELILAFSTYLSLFQLRNRPLLNPVQIVVLLFHWWFAIGPSLAVLFAVLRDDNSMLSLYMESSGVALWIVSLGLPLYAFCANGTMLFCRGRVKSAPFLNPDGLLYRPKTIYAYWLVGGFMMLVIAGMAKLGIVGSQAVNYLGGTVSANWFVSALETISSVSFYATVGVMAYLVGPKQKQSLKFKLLAIGLIIFNTLAAITSGWKSALVMSFVILLLITFVWKQKVPILIVLGLALFYLVIVEPFVASARIAAEVARISTPEERTELFRLALSRGLPTENRSILDVNIESPFRGIYDLAGRISSESSLFDGPWSDTMTEGLLALVPRSIYPDKPETNMGNFFAQSLGESETYDTMTNVGVSIPFEFVGNYGYVAGILSFGLIGILWTLLCVWILSLDRLATHPLSSLYCIFALTRIEASVQQFLAHFRDLPIILVATYVIWLVLKKRL